MFFTNIFWIIDCLPPIVISFFLPINNKTNFKTRVAECSILSMFCQHLSTTWCTNEKWWTESKLKLIRKKVFDARAAYWILNFDVLEVYALNVSSSLHGQYPNSFYAVSYIIPLNCITINRYLLFFFKISSRQ